MGIRMTWMDKLELFSGQIGFAPTVYTWLYDGEGQLVKSNCPDEAILHKAFTLFGCKEELRQQHSGTKAPVMLGAPIGMIWAADFVRQEDANYVVVLGPVFGRDVSLKSIEEILHTLSQNQEMDMSIATRLELMEVMDRVPVCMPVMFNQYALMLHYTLTGEHLTGSDIVVSDVKIVDADQGNLQKRDRHKVWAREQGLMRMVREGDLNYREALENSTGISNGVPLQSNEPLRQAKTSVIVFTSLCVRAAIEGGLMPEVAYSVGDSYIQSVENAQKPSELVAISNIMYEDFVRRVHNSRNNPNLSKPIQNCCYFIEQNVERKPNIKELAQQVGYTEYYLSRKFKEEVGISLNSYIKMVKVERAKFLLTSTEATIQEISDRLDFCSRSYFGETFRKLVGCSPIEYREGKWKE
jgi:AraC-like DNA-binding protein